MKKKSNPNFSVRYDQAEITYVSQFLASPGNEELLLDLSSGLIANATADSAGSNSTILPIQNRVALPWSVAERLANVLNQVIATRKQTLAQGTTQATATEKRHPEASDQATQLATSVPHATLPRMASAASVAR